ncbi:hypothetical protein GN244_ATG04028 [Phytophthora infestans]|uniref:Transmembrane protein n=1 Tax=Phytophthora infestans TaxID=4787 RepID=A0A833W604_PHYIN|nr:hypothetical protein GN244_ATG04028 [Phytophthora infestans]KAF4149035.1 hypothetical protein GN958_ATG01799 [Phytophthora infestans]
MKAPKQAQMPWKGWAFVYAVALATFSIYRFTALSSLMKMYGGGEESTVIVVLGISTLGFLEDFVCTTYFAGGLWLAEAYLKPRALTFYRSRLGVKILTSLVSWLLFVAMMLLFVADVLILLVRPRRDGDRGEGPRRRCCSFQFSDH